MVSRERWGVEREESHTQIGRRARWRDGGAQREGGAYGSGEKK